MKPIRIIALAALATLLMGCAARDVASRGVPLEAPGLVVQAPMFTVTRINVDVPRDLKVSEANRYYPMADIVWRGDPIGDRHAQVKAIFEDGMGRAAARMSGPHPIEVDVKVVRFHSLTEKTRYTVGGTHSIKFYMQARDARTGVVVIPPRFVDADLPGFGGRAAIAAEQRGLTQKVRITAHLGEMLRQQLARPQARPNS